MKQQGRRHCHIAGMVAVRKARRDRTSIAGNNVSYAVVVGCHLQGRHIVAGLIDRMDNDYLFTVR